VLARAHQLACSFGAKRWQAKRPLDQKGCGRCTQMTVLGVNHKNLAGSAARRKAYEATWQRSGTNLDEDPHKGRDRHLPSLSFRDQAFLISSTGNLRMANKLLNGSMALQALWQALFQIALKGPGFYRKLRCDWMLPPTRRYDSTDWRRHPQDR
jgi:hypothetical protein